MNRETEQHYYTKEKDTDFCGGCRSNCPLSNPNCPTGMERAGWNSEEIEKAMISRAVPINKGSHLQG